MTDNIKNGPIRTLTHVVGHDVNGKGGRQDAVNFLGGVVTPEMFGYTGSNLEADTVAFETALSSSYSVRLQSNKTYTVKGGRLLIGAASGTLNNYRIWSSGGYLNTAATIKLCDNASGHLITVDIAGTLWLDAVVLDGNKANQSGAYDNIHALEDTVNGYPNHCLRADNSRIVRASGHNIYAKKRSNIILGVGGKVDAQYAKLSNIYLDDCVDTTFGLVSAIFSESTNVWLKGSAFKWVAGDAAFAGHIDTSTLAAGSTVATNRLNGLYIHQDCTDVYVAPAVIIDHSAQEGVYIKDTIPGGATATLFGTNRRKIRLDAQIKTNSRAGTGLFSEIMLENPTDVVIGATVGTNCDDSGVVLGGGLLSKYGVEHTGDSTFANVLFLGVSYDTKVFLSGFTSLAVGKYSLISDRRVLINNLEAAGAADRVLNIALDDGTVLKINSDGQMFYESLSAGLGTPIANSKQIGDANQMYTFDRRGRTRWGAGGASALDVALKRGAADILELEAGDSFRALGGLGMTPLAAAPSSPWTGMQALANRTGWDPLAKGSGGAYWVWWSGSAWLAIDAQA